MNFLNLFKFFNIEIIVLFFITFILIIYLLNIWLKLSDKDILIISLFLIILMLYCSISNINDINSSIYFLNNYFIFNKFLYLIKNFMLVCMFFYMILLYNFNHIIKLPIFEYLILIWMCFFGLLMIVDGNNLFVIFLFLELVNLCIYCLIGLNKDSNLGIESAYKYFVQSSVATIIGFFGISLIYLSAGTLNLNELSILMTFNDASWLFILGVYLITSSVFFKLGVFPLHSWIPDVYQGAFLISVIFIAILPKIAYVVLFFKLFVEFHSIINNYCLIFSLLSIFYGSVISLYQTSFKRLLAYGSMVHMGLIVYSISLFTVQSITSAFFYLASYIILMLFTFSFMFFLFEKNNNELYYMDSISQFSNLAGNKLLVFSFSLILFSMAGLPFFLGFISKWYIFLSLLNNYNYFELFLLLGISVLSASYYIRLIRFIFFSESKNEKVKMYSTIKFNLGFYDLLVVLIFINIFIILIHNSVYLFILQNIIASYL